ncbi:DUF4926 domain-containing protein [Candidatus Thiodictyon syntrophicum]|jgi:hypothetical protein|uniref:DUF4926 domain-containing protein n=1 Tax=Candidatus Thiodictyon syntrophicum TaxID=1166950 RepID=A0A2K8U3L5_9GAMM|nr:DUF4926 domain-containing protein [Candidatus Thiodictyon syntrophicum]AUB80184.1 DUF4926 domain-containing protein [Candidatus Thiodictyon syntrophicum]
MNQAIKLFDVVALTTDLPEIGLVAGQVGTVVEPLGSALGDDAYEVEFIDDAGRTYALAGINAARLLVLHYDPAQAATA